MLTDQFFIGMAIGAVVMYFGLLLVDPEAFDWNLNEPIEAEYAAESDMGLE